MDESPKTKEELIKEIGRGGSGPSSVPPREQARAQLDILLMEELTSGLSQLTEGLSAARKEMKQASEVASKHTSALVWATWALAGLTAVLAGATVLSLFWRVT
jgi:hypothetical protein